MNQELMTKNILKPRMGAVAQVDVIKDLQNKKKYNLNSWFAIGHFETEGHILDYLFHIMKIDMPMPKPIGGTKWQLCISILDETSGFYFSKDHVCKDSEVEIHDDEFYIKMPTGYMSGNWDKMNLYVKEGDIEIDTVATAIDYPILTRGSSVFELLGMIIHQYSVPFMKTSGTIKLNGNTYDITDKGYTWFDRQWQAQNFRINTKWSWMAVYLDCGDVLSILDCDVPGEQQTFMSVLKPDGTLVHSTNFVPFKEIESGHYTSKISGQTYATHWDLDLPDFNAKLQVEPIVKNQEIPSVMKKLSKYEGTCKVAGTYMGKQVTGRATVELINI